MQPTRRTELKSATGEEVTLSIHSLDKPASSKALRQDGLSYCAQMHSRECEVEMEEHKGD